MLKLCCRSISKIIAVFMHPLTLLTLFKCFLASLLSMPAKSVAKNDPTPVTRSMLKTGTHAVTKSSTRPIIHFEGSKLCNASYPEMNHKVCVKY
jgi:hypothetical protein